MATAFSLSASGSGGRTAKIKTSNDPSTSGDRFAGRLEQLIAKLPLLAWATDSNLRVNWIDGGALETLGLESACVIGRSISEIFAFSETTLVDHHRKALSGRSQSFEIVMADRWYDVVIQPITDDRKKIVGSAGIARDITEEKRAERTILWHTSFDPITGALSRRRFYERFESLLRERERAASEVVILYADIDDFGAINDSIGGIAADVVLRAVANRMMAMCPEGACVGRVGADEFAVILPDVAFDAVEPICRELNAHFAEPLNVEGISMHLSISIGAALFPRDGNTVDRLLLNACAASRQAFEMGGNQSRVYSPALASNVSERLQMEKDLRHALDHNELFLMYQPQVRLSDGSISGVETLLRWRKDGDVVPAWSFIRRAEESPLMIPIGEWVLDNAIKQFSEWKQLGLETGRIAVNIGARQLSDQSIVAAIRRSLESHSVAAGSLDLEITETAAMQNLETSTQLIGDLRTMGAAITVDDFGTGYSSLSYLARFPITGLKIDRSFIAELPQSGTAIAIVDAIISTAHALGVRVVAEGVETKEQAAHLRAAGCTDAQGFLYARPLTAEGMTQFLTKAQRPARRSSRKKTSRKES